MKCAFEFSLEVYPVRLLVSIGQSDDEIRLHMDELARPGDKWKMLDGCYAFCITIRDGFIMIRFKEYIDTPICHGVIAHEVFHAAHFVMDYIEHALGSKDNGEPFAYLIEFITCKIYSEIETRTR